MTFEQIYSAVRTAIVIAATTVLVGGFYAFLVAMFFRVIFDLEEETALLWIGGPLSLVFGTLAFIYMPAHLRKAGFIE